LQCAHNLVVSGERGRDGAVAVLVDRAFLLGEPEIEQLDSLLRHQDVGRLEVAMDDALLVGRGEGVEDLIRVRDGFLDWEGPFQRLTFDQLHDKVVRANVIKLADIRVVEGGNRARFAFEALRESFGCDFDRDRAVEPRVESLLDLAHAACANACDDFVWAEEVSCRELHMSETTKFTT
jgi:hypothetical protein